jgi:NADH dehydrogenase (ubiquinone) 1 alpha subcomplex subunit 5
MRRTLRLLANVKPARYLEAGVPTGLTGLPTHASPRSTLLYLYNSTLEKLQAVPEHSLYRQSVEALTKHRLGLVSAAEPAGYKEWEAKALKLVEENPAAFNSVSSAQVDGGKAFITRKNGQTFLVRHPPPEVDIRDQEWDGEIDEGPELEGHRTAAERADQALMAQRTDLKLSQLQQIKWDAEPQLTADQ